MFGDQARGRLRPLDQSVGGRAVYLGASNGDDPSALAVFEAAMAAVGFSERLAIQDCGRDGTAFEGADLVLLAGGDPLHGWRSFEARGLVEPILRCWRRGALLVGVSAGAVQLGLGFQDADGGAVAMLGLAPYWVGAHEEATGWTGVASTLRSDVQRRPGLAIPFGAAVEVSPEGPIEALRKPVARVEWREGALRFRWQRPAENERRTNEERTKNERRSLDDIQ